MAVIKSDFYCDLNKPVKVQYLDGNLFSQDNMGNIFNVYVMDGGQPATIAGTVSADVIRSDGGTVAVSGSISGNACSVTFPQAVYAVPGVVSIVIKLTNSGTVTTLCAVVANVYRSSTDIVVDPGTILPSIQTLIAQINAAVASIPPDYSSLWTSIQNADITLFTDPMYLRRGYIDANGVWKSVTSSTMGHRIYPVNAGDSVVITANADQNVRILALTSDSVPVADAAAPISSDPLWSDGIDITKGTTWSGTMPSDAKWLYVNTRYTDAAMPSAISINGRDILLPVWDDVVKALSDYGTMANGLFSGLAFSTATAISATEQTPADYNNFTNAGNYYAASTSVVQHITNKPAELTAAHRLFVLATTASSRIVQIIVSNVSSVNIYKRYYNGSSWSDWTKLLDNNIVPFDEKASNAITIDANENINHYITPGNYKVISASIAEHITGLPFAVGGRLVVFTTSAETLVYQIYIRQDNTAGMYVRYGTVNDITDPTTTTWTLWKRIITNDILPEMFTILSPVIGANYWTLPKTAWAVGSLDSSGAYSSSTQYRICTPDIQTALTKMLIRPREGHRVIIRLFTNGVQTESLLPGVEGAVIEGGQQYKLMVRISPEDTSATVTVNDLYDKAMLFTMVQAIDNIAITDAPEFAHADYGLVPCGVYYPGVNDTYNAFTYNSLTSDVYNAFDALVTANSDYITKTDLGLCSDGTQHVYMYDFKPLQKSGGTMFDDIPTVFLLCGQHGYEKASVFSAYYMLKHMMENTTENPVLNYLRNHCRILCIPVANPYGFNQKIYKNYNGVNLNRNWDTEGWGEGSGEDDPTSKDYAGPYPFSEPETQEIRDAFLANKSEICLAIDYHTNGSDSPVSDYGEINAILYADNLTPIWNQFKRAVRYHIKDITSHFKEEFSLDVPEDEFCGSTIISAAHGGRTDRWFEDQNKVSCIFETFPGFPGGQVYTADVIKASEELISNFIITVFNYIKGA